MHACVCVCARTCVCVCVNRTCVKIKCVCMCVCVCVCERARLKEREDNLLAIRRFTLVHVGIFIWGHLDCQRKRESDFKSRYWCVD